MHKMIVLSESPQSRQFDVQAVRWLRPFGWLLSAWRDLRRHLRVSIAHGLLIAMFGMILLAIGGTHPYLAAATVSGFLLVGPLMTTGLCELSRRRASGEPLTFDGSLDGFSRNGAALMQLGALLAGFAIVWFVASEFLLRTMAPYGEHSVSEILYGGLLSSANPQQIIYYLAVGAALALIVFSVSVVAVPLILDRHASVGEAMRTSLKAVWVNMPAMIVWSALLVVLAAIGFATLLIGMVVVVPLMGHATWYAYKDLVR